MALNLKSTARGAALGFGIAALTFSGVASGQVIHTAGAAPGAATQARNYEKHCEDIRMVFDVAKFKGDYKTRAYSWLDGGCKGEIPLPIRGDRHNIGWFNTAAGILQTGGGIVIAPN
jgi:hypothetical protein